MFTKLSRIAAYLCCILGIISIALGLWWMSKIAGSYDLPVDQVIGLPVGPKIPLLNQGSALVVLGLALGVLSEISDRVLTRSHLSEKN